MFTANDARKGNEDELDERIEYAVRNNQTGNGATIRVYHDDSFLHSIETELQKRGFININVPNITLKGDVYFEWDT